LPLKTDTANPQAVCAPPGGPPLSRASSATRPHGSQLEEEVVSANVAIAIDVLVKRRRSGPAALSWNREIAAETPADTLVDTFNEADRHSCTIGPLEGR
jgi:hypothetical protein